MLDVATGDLIESKLVAPSPRSGTVPRSDLIDRLLGADWARIVAIAAPAGYGKSTLLGQWAHAADASVAWLTLDERDDDPVVLLTYLAEALRRVAGDHDVGLDGLVVSDGSIWSRAVPRIAQALATASKPILVVVDDVSEIRSQASRDVLAALTRDVAEGSQLVVCGRSLEGLPIAKWRAQGRILELGPRELALTLDETHLLLDAVGVRRRDGAHEAIHAYTEGWAAGVYLAGLAGGADDAGGPRRGITEYLQLAHVATLSADDAWFLTRTAALERIRPALCDAMMGRSDSAQRLAALANQNLLLIPLDDHGAEYRLHRVYRDVLRAELERAEPGATARLRRHAARWCAENGAVEDAIQYALEAGDRDYVAQLVQGIGIAVYRSGRVATIDGWLRAIDHPDVLVEHPRAAVIGGLVHALEGRAVEAARWLTMAERAAAAGAPPPEPGSTLEGWNAVLRGLLFRDGPDELERDAQVGAAEVSPFSPWYASVLLLGAISRLVNGDEDARPLLDESVEVAGEQGAVHAEIAALAARASLALDDGDAALAEWYLAKGRRRVGHHGLGDAAVAALLFAVGARTALARGQVLAARADLVRAQRMRPRLGHALPWLAVRVRLELGTALLALADPAGAMVLVREIDTVLASRPRLGRLVGERDSLARRARRASVGVGVEHFASTLTDAELRLLPFLSTHLTFPQIAARLYVSPNTIKTQSVAVYRKLGARSRSEAVERAAELGLLDDAATVIAHSIAAD